METDSEREREMKEKNKKNSGCMHYKCHRYQRQCKSGSNKRHLKSQRQQNETKIEVRNETTRTEKNRQAALEGNTKT